ncbi:MAG TPA: 23S rRNA (uracil(1939)-C(5))-methyltransferase RlmD [Acholeplasmataceae bacterium]|nr:23S rRNA (uracil(1939)-C(5))-methyltransferase RlmD [Acholeplasmataceae bacterium]
MLTVGSVILGTAVDVDYIGQGIIKHEGIVIFVKRMLKDEVAKIEIVSMKNRFAEGKIIQLVTSSPSRRNHPDLHLGSLDLLHMSDEEQLKWQHQLTKQTFEKIAGITIEPEETLTDGSFFGYRNKSVFHVMFRPTLTLGLYQEDGSGLIPIDHFVLADQTTNLIIKHLNSQKIRVDAKVFKHIVIRTNERHQALVTLVALQPSFYGKDEMLNQLKTLKEVIGITINIKDHPQSILGSKSYAIYGEKTIQLTRGSWSFPITDQSFFQVNVPVIEKAYALIKKHMLKQANLIDAYSGVGSIGLYCHEKLTSLTMIESNEDAIKVAEGVVQHHGLTNVRILKGYAEKLITDVDGDVLVVDPPRNGLMPALVQAMVDRPFEQVFYLSCDLKTLTRDVKLLQVAYNLKKVVPLRMFPQTTECETLVMLEKKDLHEDLRR